MHLAIQQYQATDQDGADALDGIATARRRIDRQERVLLGLIVLLAVLLAADLLGEAGVTHHFTLPVPELFALMVAGYALLHWRSHVQAQRSLDQELENKIAALRDSEQRFRDFAEVGTHWLWERDADGALVWISDSVGRVAGIAPDQLLGKQRSDMIGQGAEDPQLRAIEDLTARRQPFADMPASSTAAGRLVHLSISGKPVFGDTGRFMGYRGTTREITAEVDAQRALATSNAELQAASRALAASEQRFRDFAAAASDWYWEQDATLRFTYISEANERIPSLAPTQVLGLTRRETKPEGVSQEQWAEHEAALQARRPFRDFRYARRYADGLVQHVSINGIPVFDTDGAFTGYRGTGRDITAEVEAHREAAEARHERDTAAAANLGKSQFLAHMSHELRTPLNAIIGLSEIIGGQILGPIGTEKYLEYNQDIQNSARHLLDIIGDLLDMAKFEVGKFRIAPSRVAVADVANEALAIVRTLAATAEIELQTEAIDPELGVMADRRAIKQVLVNLLSNSIKFTPPGGRVRLATERTPEGHLLISIADTGPGIAPARLAEVFEPFQESADHARKGGGSGLGLWISRNLIRLHGGELNLESNQGRGTTAIVSLPGERVFGASDGDPKAA